MKFKAHQVGTGVVNNTELNTLDGIDSNIQEQIDDINTTVWPVANGGSGQDTAAEALAVWLGAVTGTPAPGMFPTPVDGGGFEWAYPGDGMSVGDYKYSFATEAPTGFLPCDGTSREQDDFPDLFAVLEDGLPDPTPLGSLTQVAATLTQFNSNSALNQMRVQFAGGLWFAFGNTSSYYYTSPDRVTWTQRSTPTSSPPRGVAYGAGLYVMALAGGLIYSSATGTGSWTARVSSGYGAFYYLIFDGTNFIAAGQNNSSSGGVHYSTDGTSWTWVNYGGTYMYACHYFAAAGLWLSWHNSAGILSQPTVAGTYTVRHALTTNAGANFCSNSTTCLAKSDAYALRRSTNGTSWSTVSGTWYAVWAVGEDFYGIQLSGSDYLLRTSTDGSTWTTLETWYDDSEEILPEPVIGVGDSDGSGALIPLCQRSSQWTGASFTDTYTYELWESGAVLLSYDPDTEFPLPDLEDNEDGAHPYIKAVA